MHVDTQQAREELINSRLAYVSVSRGRFDAQIYSDDASRMGEGSSRDVSKQTALNNGEEIVTQMGSPASEDHRIEPATPSHDNSEGHGMGH